MKRMAKSVPNRPAVDLRSALEDAEEQGEVVHINREVDPLIEIPSILAATGRLPAIPVTLFNKVAGFSSARVVGGLMFDPARMSRQMGFSGAGVRNRECWFPALDHPIPPKTVSNGPCKENIITRNIDIEKLAPATFGALKVTHRYFQPVVCTRHPKTGVINTSIYRSAIQGPDLVTTNFRWDNHGGLMLSVAKEMGVSVPVALCIGVAPAVYVAASSRMRYGYSEMDFAGGLLGRPVEVVKCETIDLEVPASSEIVIEGEIRPPYEKGSEGPWPEYLGYLGMNIHPPLLHITAVTYRNNPITLMVIPGALPPFASTPNDATLLRHVRGLVGEFAVDACISKGSRTHHAIIKVKKTEEHHEGLQINAANSAFGYSNQIDIVTLVDEDIDIDNPVKVEWAIASRCNPAKQVHILPEARTHQNNPIAGVRETINGPITKGKMIIDATIPWNFKVAEKGPGVTFFTKSAWPAADLGKYFGKAAQAKWLKAK